MKPALITMLGLSLGNFSYQAFTGENWGVAFERTYFQFWGCMTLAVLMRVFPSNGTKS
jgi:hypothetical protein